jgi:hypothetical protein
MLRRQASELRRLAGEAERATSKTIDESLTVVNSSDMQRFDSVVRAAGFRSNAKLAAAVGISPALLSRARTKGPKGRAIRKSVAVKIQQLTKWPADAAHWPNGFVEVKN